MFLLKKFVYICNIKLNINIMTNLTKELKKLAKKKIDPIHEELLEQFESARFFRQMQIHRENQTLKENKNLILHII